MVATRDCRKVSFQQGCSEKQDICGGKAHSSMYGSSPPRLVNFLHARLVATMNILSRHRAQWPVRTEEISRQRALRAGCVVSGDRDLRMSVIGCLHVAKSVAVLAPCNAAVQYINYQLERGFVSLRTLENRNSPPYLPLFVHHFRQPCGGVSSIAAHASAPAVLPLPSYASLGMHVNPLVMARFRVPVVQFPSEERSKKHADCPHTTFPSSYIFLRCVWGGGG